MRDSENSPEYSEFLYLCGNHWGQVTQRRSGWAGVHTVGALMNHS